MIHLHDDVIKWKRFPRYWPFVRGIHRSPVNSLHKGQWRGALIFFYLRLNKRLSKHSRGWWFGTPFRSFWRHCNVGITRHQWLNITVWFILFPNTFAKTSVYVVENINDLGLCGILQMTQMCLIKYSTRHCHLDIRKNVTACSVLITAHKGIQETKESNLRKRCHVLKSVGTSHIPVCGTEWAKFFATHSAKYSQKRHFIQLQRCRILKKQ